MKSHYWIVIATIFFGLAVSLVFSSFALLYIYEEHIDTSLPGNPLVREYIYRGHPLPLSLMAGSIFSFIIGVASLIGYWGSKKEKKK